MVFLQKTKKNFCLTFAVFILSCLFLVISYHFLDVWQKSNNRQVISKKNQNQSQKVNILITKVPITKSIDITPSASKNYRPNVQIFPSKNVPITNSSNKTDLLTAVNSFRNSNGIHSLVLSENLCLIAQKRLGEIIANRGLDGHAGFNKFFSSQTEFSAMGEVIFQSSSKQPPEYVVDEGWAKSTLGHRENLLDPKWNYGCGSTDGYFSVFNLGKK